MSRLLPLARRELRAQWRRNLICGLVLFLAVGTQMFTTLVAEASESAVRTYGANVFGYDATYTAEFEGKVTLAQVRALDGHLDAARKAHPPIDLAARADVVAYLSDESLVAEPANEVGLRSVHGQWQRLSASLQASTPSVK